ncbi:MAG: RlpA-like double-psi beta-barrel domain-containing protein [Actinomycetota bacterium]
MNRITLLAVALTALVSPAQAGELEDRLEDARDRQGEARESADVVAGDLAALSTRYQRVHTNAEAAAARLVDALLLESTLQGKLAQARALLENRADAFYRAGPAAFLEAMFAAESLGDLSARQVLIEHALEAGVAEAGEALAATESIEAIRREAERHRAELVARQQELEEIRTLLEIRLSAARQEARQAGVRVQALIEERRRLADLTATEQMFGDLLAVDGDLGRLLQMLGPTGGRGCQIPPDLVLAGRGFAGEASFYGEEFAGNPTAIGHIFNPVLFTAAHRTLPLPSFLHVRYGNKCATVLVNDRGPYVEGRVLDLSEGAASYLGLPGVGQVQADILVPG